MQRDAARSRVADGVGERFLRDAGDLALDAVAHARQLLEPELDRHVRRQPRAIGDAREHRGHRLGVADVGPQRPDRSPRLGHVGAREIDRGVELQRNGRGHRRLRRLALRRLQLHEDRAEALREVVVDVARQPVPLLEDRLTPLLEAAALDHAAVVQRKRGLARHRFDQHHAPPAGAFARRHAAVRQLDPPERLRPEHERRDDHAAHVDIALARAHFRRQPRIVVLVLDRLQPAVLEREEVAAERLVRERERLEAVLLRVEAIADKRHPQRAALAAVVDQPHAARVALGFLDHRLRQAAEESLDVRLAHEEIDGELHHLGLHVGEALGAAALGVLAHERGAEHLGIVRLHLDRRCEAFAAVVVL